MEKQPYSECVFRWIGCAASASLDACRKRAERIECDESGWLDEASTFLLAQGDLPWLERLRYTREALAHKISELDDWKTRLRARAFWYHASSAPDKRALQFLLAGETEEAIRIWSDAWRDDIESRISAAHNLAVLYHSRSLCGLRGSDLRHEDMREALRWWGHIIDGGRLESIVLDGENRGELDFATLTAFVEELKADITSLLSFGRYQATLYAERRRGDFEREGDGAEGGSVAFGGRVVAYRAGKTRLLLDLERAEEAARSGDRETMETILQALEEVSLAPAEQKLLAEASQRLGLRLVLRGTHPISEQPFVSSVTGMGTVLANFRQFDMASRSFSARLMLRVCYVPVLCLGRYRVRQGEDEKWDLLGKYPLDWTTVIHNTACFWLIVIAILAVSVFSGVGGRREAVSVSTFAPVEVGGITVAAKDWQRMSTSGMARFEMKRNVTQRVRQLQAERSLIFSRDIPQLEKAITVDLDGPMSPRREKALAEHRQAIKDKRKRASQIPQEINKLHDLLASIQKLED